MICTRHNFRSAGGFLLIDVMTGIVVGLAILAALSASVAQYRHGARRLSDQRAAVYLAERVLTDLQAGQTPALEGPGLTATIIDLPERGPTPNTRWVEVRVQGAAGFSLVGVAPKAGAEPALGPTPVLPAVAVATNAEAQP